MLSFCVVALTTLLFVGTDAAYCNGKPDPNALQNKYPIITDKPVVVKSVKNGIKMTYTNSLDTIPVVHLFGTPYEQGVAHAELMHDEMIAFFNETYMYFEESAAAAVTGVIPWFPVPLAEQIALEGLDAVLDAELAVTKPFTGKYYFEEIQGMADSLGDDLPDGYNMINRLLMFGELTKGSCSMFGVWGDAIPTGQSLLQLRALDWDMDGPFRDYPQVTVYHPPVETQGVAFANIGFTGFIGSLNGVNERRISTSEIGVSYPDASFGNESRVGTPFTYLLRDIVQWDTSLQNAIGRISNAHRTCDLILGVGDGKLTEYPFRGIQYSASVANFYTDMDMMPFDPTADPQWHPRQKEMVYYGMDWLCKNFDIVLARQLEASRGVLTPALAINNITALVQSGDSFVTYYEYSNTNPSTDAMYISFAGRHNATGPDKGYDRQFNKILLDVLFDVSPPTDEMVAASAQAQTALF